MLYGDEDWSGILLSDDTGERADSTIRHICCYHDQTDEPGTDVEHNLLELRYLESFVLDSSLILSHSFDDAELLFVRQATFHRIVRQEEKGQDTDGNCNQTVNQE